MKRKQSGFTLVELAIVLVIVGLLLAAILKGQELINGAKVKNLAADIRNIPSAYNGYQDRFRAIPGDDAVVVAHLGNAANLATTPATSVGNGIVNGAWDSLTTSDESVVIWQHLRLAGLLPGSAAVSVAAGNNYLPTNFYGGRIGISGTGSAISDASFTGNYYICTAGIPGRVARQLDQVMDDGVGTTGSVRATATSAAPAAAAASSDYADATTYTVCVAQ